MTGPLGESFGALVESTERDVRLLAALAALRPCESGALPGATELKAIDSFVADLEEKMSEMETFMTSEQAALCGLANAAASLEGHRSLLDHLHRNLPRQLPGHDGGRAPVDSKTPTVNLVTHGEFFSVPITTRERLKHDDINEVVKELQDVLAQKHKLLGTPRESVPIRDREAWQTLQSFQKQQREAEYSESFFFTEHELRELPALKAASKSQSKLRSIVHTLRHLGRLRSVNTGYAVE